MICVGLNNPLGFFVVELCTTASACFRAFSSSNWSGHFHRPLWDRAFQCCHASNPLYEDCDPNLSSEKNRLQAWDQHFRGVVAPSTMGREIAPQKSVSYYQLENCILQDDSISKLSRKFKNLEKFRKMKYMSHTGLERVSSVVRTIRLM